MICTWLRPVGFLGCCLLAACGSSPPTRFYILNEIAPRPTAHGSRGGQIPVRVEPVAIPPELDRSELVFPQRPQQRARRGSGALGRAAERSDTSRPIR